MKLILTQDVPNLGAPGDVVEVKDGYGRNYLVPRGFAIVATKGAEKQVATIRRAREVREVRDLGSAQTIAAQLADLTVKLPARSGEGGRLFGSVTTTDVVEAVSAAGGPKLDRRMVTLPARSGDGGRLFGSVTSNDLVEAITAAGGPKLDRRMVTLTAPIKATGNHTATVKVHPEVEATVTVQVVAAK